MAENTSASTSSSETRARRSYSRDTCAACLHQRRKCPPDCLLAPYFPRNEPVRFRSASRLFGISNMQRAIRFGDKCNARDAVMRTILFHSIARQEDPVDGCIGHIGRLKLEIQRKSNELQRVNEQLLLLRSLSNQYQEEDGRQSDGTSLQMVQQQLPPQPTDLDDDNSHTCNQDPSLQYGSGEGLPSKSSFESWNQSSISFSDRNLERLGELHGDFTGDNFHAAPEQQRTE